MTDWRDGVDHIESAEAMHELYLAYMRAGFTHQDAVYLCGVALAVIAQTEHAAQLAEATRVGVEDIGRTAFSIDEAQRRAAVERRWPPRRQSCEACGLDGYLRDQSTLDAVPALVCRFCGHRIPVDQWGRRAAYIPVCAECGRQAGEHTFACSRYETSQQAYADRPPGTVVGPFTFRCAICAGPLVEDDGRLFCPDHPPADGPDPEERHL
jgi:hypothetical protein